MQIDEKETAKLHRLIYDTNVREMWDLDQLIGEEGWDQRYFLIQLPRRPSTYVKGSQVRKTDLDDPRHCKGQLFILK